MQTSQIARKVEDRARTDNVVGIAEGGEPETVAVADLVRFQYEPDIHARMIEFVEIDRDGCTRMLAAASGGVGRIAVSVPGSPALIRPVNYAFDDRTESVVFRSALGSKLGEGLSGVSGATAAFEIDGTDPVERTGWSVIIGGEAEEVTDSAEIDRLEDFELEPWAPGLKTHWVRIHLRSASGRRIVDRGKWGLR